MYGSFIISLVQQGLSDFICKTKQNKTKQNKTKQNKTNKQNMLILQIH